MGEFSANLMNGDFFDGTTWAAYALDVAKNEGADPEVILAQSGLQRADLYLNERIPVYKSLKLFDLCASSTDNDLFGLDLIEKIDLRDIGLLWYLAVNSPNVQACLKNIQRYYKLQQNHASLEIIEDSQSDYCANTVLVVERSDYVKIDSFVQFDEFSWLCFLHAIRKLARIDIAPIEIGLINPRTSNTTPIRQFTKCETIFGAERNFVRFTQEQHLLPIPNHEFKLLQILKAYGDDILEKQAHLVPHFENEVTRHVIAQLPRGRAKLKVIARELGVSERSLSRRLADSGTTFAQIVDNTRRELFGKYAVRHDLSLAQIAFLLGFSDQSAMNSAVKRWSGETPTKYRTKLQGTLQQTGSSQSK